MNELQRFEYKSTFDGMPDWGMFNSGTENGVAVVVLHGHGSHGDQLATREDIKKEWLPLLLDRKVGILCPNLRDNAWMCPAAAHDLRETILCFKERFRWKRIILASGSMGGTGNLIFSMLHPELISGVVALGAATDLRRYSEWCATQTHPILKEIRNAITTNYKDSELDSHSVCRHAERLTMPVWLVHGATDETIPVSESRELRRILSAKKDFHYEEIPGGNHDSPLWSFRKCVTECLNSIK